MRPEQALEWLARWCERGWIRPLDKAFAAFLYQLEPGGDGLPLLAGALASHQLGRGHICLGVSELASGFDSALALPENAASAIAPEELPSERVAGIGEMQWLAALQNSALVLAGQGDTPLVLVGGRLYLRRYWQYEVDVAAGVMARVQTACPLADDFADILQQLFAAPTLGQVDWQQVACALAARKAFCVITGGPGTGKTTTVVKLLALLQSGARKQGRLLRIRLAAPTGKAAARLTESIAQSITDPRVGIPLSMQADIPTEASTLHKLLGARPGTRHLLHNRENPLHADVVIVDEASMVDLEMMAALLNALRPETRLLLLGDKDQLASVEAGSVLGDLCVNAVDAGYDADTSAWLEQTVGFEFPLSGRPQPRLDQQIAMLRVSHRFGEFSGIGRLACAVNAGDLDAVHAVWAVDAPFTDIKRIALDGSDVALQSLVVDGWADGEAVGYRHYLELLAEQRPCTGEPDAYLIWADTVLAAFDRFQLLCALRQGDFGVETLNQRIAEWLRQQGLIAQTHGWYEGRPVLVTRNDYALGLMNGDIGIALNMPDANGEFRLRVVFKDSQRRLKQVLPSRLHDAESVYAMTVHKSQGSEFEHVALLLPDRPSPILTRELVYTGITRAKRRFSLLGSNEAVLRQAIAQRVKRAGGLRELLS